MRKENASGAFGEADSRSELPPSPTDLFCHSGKREEGSVSRQGTAEPRPFDPAGAQQLLQTNSRRVWNRRAAGTPQLAASQGKSRWLSLIKELLASPKHWKHTARGRLRRWGSADRGHGLPALGPGMQWLSKEDAKATCSLDKASLGSGRGWGSSNNRCW